MTKHSGFWYPQTRSGTSAILPAPPWHYVGNLIKITYRADPGNLRQFLPDDVELTDGSGAVSLNFADWQSCSDGGRELLDPVRAQYKECFFDVEVRYRGNQYGRVILIWVDKEFSLVRGLYQGYPKKHGSIWMTRSFPVGRAAPQLERGGRLAATLAAADRRLIEATITLTEPAKLAARDPLPRLHSRRMPSITPSDPDSLDELVVFQRHDTEQADAWSADAEINVFTSPTEELDLLAPLEVIGASYVTTASTWSDGRLLEARHLGPIAQ